VCPRRVWRYKDVDFPKAMGMIDAINWSTPEITGVGSELTPPITTL